MTSPSTRWINSPGVCLRWNSWSSPRTWRVMSRRRPLVIRHAATVAERTTTTLTTWVTMATTRNRTPRRTTSLAVVPSVASSTMRRTINGPARAPADADGDERAEQGPPAGIRPDQRCQGTPARRRCLRHAMILAAGCAAKRGGFQSVAACSAIDAAPTIPASFSSEATAISTSTSTYLSHFSDLRLTPPPMINKSGENRNTTCSR